MKISSKKQSSCGMTEVQIKKLAEMLDPGIWKNPGKTIRDVLTWYRDNYQMRPVAGTGDRPIPCPPDYRDIAKFIIRSGEPLTKEQKKNRGINPITKATTSIYDHFTGDGLTVCVKESQILSLAISSIEIHLEKLHDWGKWGTKKVEFMPTPDTCPICAALAGDYKVGECPIPVLDTHLECRCSITFAKSEV